MLYSDDLGNYKLVINVSTLVSARYFYSNYNSVLSVSMPATADLPSDHYFVLTDSMILAPDFLRSYYLN
jgi:hypothetical protein